MTVWVRAEAGLEEWIQILNIYVFYVGIYILILAAVIVMLVSFLGCCSALMEHTKALVLVNINHQNTYIYYEIRHKYDFLYSQFIATQLVSFVVSVAGSAVLLDYSTLNSSIQPLLHHSFRRLIMSSGWQESAAALKMIQENVSTHFASSLFIFSSSAIIQFFNLSVINSDRLLWCWWIIWLYSFASTVARYVPWFSHRQRLLQWLRRWAHLATRREGRMDCWTRNDTCPYSCEFFSCLYLYDIFYLINLILFHYFHWLH